MKKTVAGLIAVLSAFTMLGGYINIQEKNSASISDILLLLFLAGIFIISIAMFFIKGRPSCKESEIIERIVEVPVIQEKVVEKIVEVPVYINEPPGEKKVYVANMTGTEFEAFCCRVFEKNHFENIHTTVSTGDHGVDIIAWRAKRKFAIQCKRYNANVSNKAVQEVYTGKKLVGAGEAAVITNSYFTAQAKAEANELGVILWDRDKLREMVKNAELDDVIV